MERAAGEMGGFERRGTEAGGSYKEGNGARYRHSAYREVPGKS